jgi:hypothetical protein
VGRIRREGGNEIFTAKKTRKKGVSLNNRLFKCTQAMARIEVNSQYWYKQKDVRRGDNNQREKKPISKVDKTWMPEYGR